MAWNLTPAALASSLGSLPLIALGAWVSFLRPHRRVHVAFGLTATGFGVGWGLHWLLPTADEPIVPLWFFVSGLGFVASALGAVLVALWLPLAGPTLGRRNVLVALAVGTAYTVASTLTTAAQGLRSGFPGIFEGSEIPWWLYAWSASVDLQRGGWWAALILLAFQFRRAPAEAGRERRQVALMSAALVVWLGFRDAVFFGSAGVEPQSIVILVLMGLFTVLWLWNTSGFDGRVARNVLFIALLVALLARIWILSSGGYEPAVQSPIWGILRIASVSILAYAILKHHLLGLDVRLRWTISRSTIAALFVAVFFIASEGAQQFLGDTLGSTYVGIASTGALVFALAPLQRAAERLAAKAVPPAPSQLDDARRGEAERAYGEALAGAMRDGRITPHEELALARIADLMGLAPSTVTRIRQDVVASRVDPPKRRRLKG